MKSPLFAVTSVIFALALSFPWVKGEDLQDILVVSEDGSKISVHADYIPLQQLLSKLAETSNLNIYFAPSLSEVPVTVSFDNLPVDKAVPKLLKDFNYLAGFKREKEVDRLATLKIYPKGTAKGFLVPVVVEGAEEVGGMPATPGPSDQTFERLGERRKGPDSPEVPEQIDQTFQDYPDSGRGLLPPEILEEEHESEANGTKVPSTPK